MRITTTLDATCNVDFNTCLAVMNEFGRTIKNDSNCAADYATDNPLVLQAYNGLLAYQPLYQAGCLRDSRGNYCKLYRQLYDISSDRGPIRFCKCHHKHNSCHRLLSLLPTSRCLPPRLISANLRYLSSGHNGHLFIIRWQYNTTD